MRNCFQRILETPADMHAVEDLQRLVWPGSDLEVVPAHMLLTAAHNGGLVVGAFETAETAEDEGDDLDFRPGLFRPAEANPGAPLLGFVFGFPGLYFTPDGPRLKHCSHMLGVHPEARDGGIGFKLKRAQWQMVRHQGIDRITWTFDPLLSRNAHLNITRLGGVCNTYRQDEYGEMRDGGNVGLPTDRFQVDWWVNSQRVNRRLSKRARLRLDLAHFLAAGAEIINPSISGEGNLPQPSTHEIHLPASPEEAQLLLVEIPGDFAALRAADLDLALQWRLHTRTLFQDAFTRGYLVTDFIHLPGTHSRSFYVLSHGESTF